jgi:hypothetical protein
MTALSGWQNFYVIMGSSAGALIGLQFVVMALIADMPAARGQEQAGVAFATPTVVKAKANRAGEKARSDCLKFVIKFKYPKVITKKGREPMSCLAQFLVRESVTGTFLNSPRCSAAWHQN